MRQIIALTTGILLFILMGCESNPPKWLKQEGIQITEMNAAIGDIKGDEENTYRQSMKYSVTIKNYDKNDFYITSIEPVLVNKFIETTEKKENKVVVNKNLPPKQSLTFDGELFFSTKSLTKEDIKAMEPYIEGFKVSEEHIVKRIRMK